MSSAAFAVLNLLFVVVVVLVVWLLLLLACFTSASRLVLLMFLATSWPFVLARPPRHKVIFSYYLQRGRQEGQRPGTFCGWPTHSKKERRKETKRIGIINSLLHLLLSGANCVFVYIIFVLLKSLLKALPPSPCHLPAVHFKLTLFLFFVAQLRLWGGVALGRLQFMERVEPRTVVNGTWTHRRLDKLHYYVTQEDRAE